MIIFFLTFDSGFLIFYHVYFNYELLCQRTPYCWEPIPYGKYHHFPCLRSSNFVLLSIMYFVIPFVLGIKMTLFGSNIFIFCVDLCNVCLYKLAPL